ncbi:hypothetical protein FSP39_023877 [Pinctada imbricata]|uniref:Transcriptional coactivator p15 (PC4) C-terminal domain-containing protein n=1 Tax=Pinctada imbricata TaxID=66713 RepID=A0AA88YS80_PINIB|nr:hypothetical protein FSP39_023877 [Pinctada imbricata]
MEEMRVDLREWVPPNKPTTKGVSFPFKRWASLRDHLELIDEKATAIFDGQNVDERIHIVGNVHVSINSKYPGVDIRHFWFPVDSDEPRASRKGLSLKPDEWQKFKATFPKVEDMVDGASEAQACIHDDDHQNQEGMLRCPEYSPRDYQNWQ